MNVPKVIADLVEAQNNSDSTAFSNLFSETAVVKDEGHRYQGKDAVKKWNEATTEKYAPKIKFLKMDQDHSKTVVAMEVSGNFDGSPAVLHYHFEIKNDEITALEIS